MKRPSFFNLSLLLFFLVGIAFAGSRRPTGETPDEPALAVPASPAQPAPEKTPPSIAVFLALQPDEEPDKLIELLKKHPELKLTLLFPPHYFDAEPRRNTIETFLLLQSSKQIEVGLSLENEPILPLLGDLQLAGEKVSKWGFTFAWPEDIAAQVARASGKYQKRWGTLPSGFYPPHLALSEQVTDTLKKFRLNWVLGKPQDTWGVRFHGGMALLVPPPPSIDPDEAIDWALEHPFVLVDGGATYLETLLKRASKIAHPPLFVTGKEFVESLRDEYTLPKNVNPFAFNYDDWVETPQQKRVWTALVSARQAIDAYQRSGRANLQRLDAAVEEMCNVESGEFLTGLGQRASANSFNERNFLATLGNIYRLCEAPVPANLNTWFAARTWQKAAVKSAENDRPFFVEGPQSLTWNDPKGDDNGDGKFVYPIGSYPKGMFDLREFTLSWTDTDVTFSIEVMADVDKKATNVVPLVDIYVDVNRLPGAGSTTPLKDRESTLILRDAAWEYALAINPNTGALYQSVPGSNPRVLEIKSSETQAKAFNVTFPRNWLRGDPKHWRLSVGLMGTVNNRRQEESVPVPVLAAAGEKNFGGAPNGRAAPYVDLLTATSDDQAERIAANEAGGPLNLPYVESQ